MRAAIREGADSRAINRMDSDLEVTMNGQFTGVLQQRGSVWIGWIEEVPGVNSQGETREGLIDNLRSALDEALEMNRADALAATAGGPYEEVRLTPAA